jgi:beta-lactam-binding protein with PASTA domain
MDTTLQDPSGSAGDTPPVGQLLDGRYRVDARVAIGGMATVYRALDTRLDREVALKVMHPSLAADSEFIERFMREARSIARLAHPNVVGVFDQGTDGPYVYLAMEYVPGCTLRDVLRERGALQVRAALDVLEPVLAALGAAHRAGFVHRDMKPENVLIADDGRVKVADFGLARAVDSQTSVGTDSILGTVSYLAPEQIEHGTADTRTDLYACGVMLYEMLTGDKPHMGGTPAQILYQHLHQDVPAPSAAVPSLAPGLDSLVAMSTARDPGRRPYDAGAMLSETRAVRAALSTGQLDAVPPRAEGMGTGPEDRTSVLPRPAALAAHDVHDAYDAGYRPGPGGDGLESTAKFAAPPPGDRYPGDRHGEPPGSHRRTRENRRGHGRLFLALLAVVLLALIGTGVWYVSAGQFTRTPAVLDKTEPAAVQALHAAGLDVKVTRNFSDSTGRGHVIETSPSPGSRIRNTGTVTLVVSRGPRVVKLPDLAGTPLTDARRKLKDAGLTPGAVTRKFDEDTAKGSVIATHPGSGTERRPGSAVALTVSRGQAIDVPDVTGEDPGDARQDLREEGLRLRVSSKRVFSDEDRGTVAGQSPAEGATVAKGDTVTVTLSKGKDMVRVPDVGDLSEGAARKKLKAAGFEVTTHRLFLGDTVFHQSPGSGDEAPRGSNITLWLR